MTETLDQKRREVIRWDIIRCLNLSSPYPVGDTLLLEAVGGMDMPITMTDIRRALDYLEGRRLITVEGRSQPKWIAKLTRHGVDLAEYVIECEPGIARPVKYWG